MMAGSTECQPPGYPVCPRFFSAVPAQNEDVPDEAGLICLKTLLVRREPASFFLRYRKKEAAIDRRAMARRAAGDSFG